MASSLYKTVIILAMVGLIFPSISLAQEIKIPGTLGEVKEFGVKIIKAILEKLPAIIVKTWKEEALPVWQKMWNWFKNIWNLYIWPKIEWLWQKILSLFGKEMEKRKPIIEEEFKKEKKELKEELPGVKKSLWEKFKELIK